MASRVLVIGAAREEQHKTLCKGITMGIGRVITGKSNRDVPIVYVHIMVL